MAKITLNDISNLQNETTVTSAINENNRRIEEAVENTLSRSGGLPNNMNATLDMNSNRIINLPNAVEDSEPITLGQLQEIEDITANTIITAVNEPSLPQSRMLISGLNISLTDSGAQNTLAISLDDAELNAIASAGSAANTVPFYTGIGSASTTPLTSYSRSLIASNDEVEAKTVLNLENVDNTSDSTKNSATAILTNKTIDTAGPNTIKINGNTLDAAAGTATLTFPNTTDTLVGRNTTDTLTNKTLTTPVINSPTGITKGDVGLGNVDNTSDVNKPVSTATQTELNLKADKTITVSAGTGLTGGGDLSANRTVELDSSSIASLALADTAVQPARAVNTGTGLTGGGDLSADRTIALDSASQASLAKADTAVQPADLGDLAVKNKITVPSDINYTGTPDGTKFLRDDGSFVSIPGGGDLLAANNLSDLDDADTSIANLGSNLCWYSRGIGEIVYVDTSIAGVSIPPQSHTDLVFVQLTAGLTGSGQYNENKLTSESVTGAAPLVVATAIVDVSGSPIYGKTIHLLNSEEAILRPRASGVGSLQQDQMQQITGEFGLTTRRAAYQNGAFSGSTAVTQDRDYLSGSAISFRDPIVFDSADSPDARAGAETRMKNVGVTAYMRIK